MLADPEIPTYELSETCVIQFGQYQKQFFRVHCYGPIVPEESWKAGSTALQAFHASECREWKNLLV